MSFLNTINFKLRSVLKHGTFEDELDQELRSHLEQLIDDFKNKGHNDKEARELAIKEFGNILQLKERVQESWGTRTIMDIFRDVTFGLRQLTKYKGFSFVAIFTLALCIGANSSIFSVVNAVLLKPFPYPESENLVYSFNRYSKNNLDKAAVSIPDYLDRIERAPSIETGAIYHWKSFNLSPEGVPFRVLGLRASPSLFNTLKVQPILGRAFTDEEAITGADKVVVLTHSIWKEDYGADESIVGKKITLNSTDYTVLGVMAEEFYFPNPGVKLYVPFAFTPEEMSFDERGNEYSDMIVRLKPGATVEKLTEESEVIVKQNVEEYPDSRDWIESSGFTGFAVSILDEHVEYVRPMLWLLQAGVVAALLIGCANVANLLLTRTLAREKELSIRVALGAGKMRLAQQLLTECLLLFIAGGLMGLLVARGGLWAMDTFGMVNLPRSEGIALDLSVFSFTMISAGLTGAIFGVIPAMQASRADASHALKSMGTRTTSSRNQKRLRQLLVISEIALSIVLLTTSILLIRSFNQLQSQAPGFESDSVLTCSYSLPSLKYDNTDSIIQFNDKLIHALNTTPGVQSTSLNSQIPFGSSNFQGSYRIEEQEQTEGSPVPHGHLRSVSADYFKTLSIPLLQGRLFNEFDTKDSPKVVIIDKVLADKYWPNEDPLGKRIYRGESIEENMRTIIGIVSPVKHYSLSDTVKKETIYFPYSQYVRQNYSLMIKTTANPAVFIDTLRKRIQTVDPELPVFSINTMDELIDRSLQTQKTPMLLIGIFGGIALLLASLGVYGVIAFNVGQRYQEIGIRMALGAGASETIWMIVRQGIWLILIGTLLGMACFAATSKLLQHLVYEVSPLDPLSIFLAPLILILVAITASIIPAMKATKIDPIIALRTE